MAPLLRGRRPNLSGLWTDTSPAKVSRLQEARRICNRRLQRVMNVTGR